ncbi:MAG: Sua5/YciO/YrdC/YwlC family protein [Phycisphaerales bacterium JB061]
MTDPGQISVFKPSEAAYKAAAIALKEGHLVILPTETIYGVFGSESQKPVIEGLTKLFGERPTSSAGWHAPSAEIALERANANHPTHQRLLERLLPGPVGIIFESGGSVRVPDNAAALAVLQTAYDAGMDDIIGVGMIGPPFATSEEVMPAIEDEAVRAKLEDAGVRVVIDGGKTALGTPSTIIRLTPGGSYEITREGPVGERYINERLRRRVLFVCTGNTCRSPMAESIARKITASPEGLVSVSSAGIMAGEGMPMTPEAADALRTLGYEPHNHRSRQVSQADVSAADEIFGLTASHVSALRQAFPGSAWKVTLLDPDGNDVPDPIGAPAAVYNQTCQTLEKLIEQRLADSGSRANQAGKEAGP